LDQRDQVHLVHQVLRDLRKYQSLQFCRVYRVYLWVLVHRQLQLDHSVQRDLGALVLLNMKFEYIVGLYCYYYFVLLN
jgi:hypothetical protein